MLESINSIPEFSFAMACLVGVIFYVVLFALFAFLIMKSQERATIYQKAFDLQTDDQMKLLAIVCKLHKHKVQKANGFNTVHPNTLLFPELEAIKNAEVKSTLKSLINN